MSASLALSIGAPASKVIGQGQSAAISGVSLSEPGAIAGETFTAHLTDTDGLLSASHAGGATVTGSGSNNLTISGTLAQVNAALATLTDLDSTAGTDTVHITATDSLGNVATARDISVTTNGLPVITAPASTTVNQAVSTAIAGLSLAESGNTTGETFTADLTNTNGLLSASNAGGATVTGSGTSHLVISGTLAQVNAALGTVSDTDADADTIHLTATDSFGNSANANIAVAVNAASQVFNLTTGTDNFHGAGGADTFNATSGTLSSGDILDGGGGANVLALNGAGTFNLGAPATITGISTITAREGQTAFSSGGVNIAAQNQVVTLRDGLNGVTLNVASATLNANNPRPGTITVVAGNNNAVINLGSGNDAVTLGSNLQIVHGGSGANTFSVTSASIGATIQGGGSGQNQLVVTGGGTMVMGSNITQIATVNLTTGASAYNFTANAIAGLVVNDLSNLADTIAAGASGQTLASGVGNDTMVGFGSGVTTYKTTAARMTGDTIRNFSVADRIDLSDVAFGADTTVAYSPTNSTQGTLTVAVNGVQRAQVTLFGQLMNASFSAESDGAGGTLILDHPVQSQAAIAIPAGA